MKKNKSIKLNFIMNVILTMSSFIFPLITFPYVSRILLPEGTGKVSFATSLISYFSMFAQLGIPTYGIRACAKVRDDKEELTRTTQELVIINFVMSVISYTALAVALMLVPRLREERALYIIVSLTIAFNVIGMEWMYKALEQYTYITIRSIIFKFVALIVMFVFVHQKSDYIFYGAITILAASGSNIFNFINAHKFIDMRPVGKYHFKRHFKPIAVFFAMSCATTIYTHLDTVMLGFMTTDADVGYYNAAVKIKTILVSIVTSLGVVLLPRASYYIEHKMIDEFYRIAHKAINFVFLIALPMMLYFMIFAKEGIFFLSGSAYEKSILPMQVIMPTLLFIGLTNVMGIQMLVPLGKEKIVLYSEIAGAVVDLIVNFALIPRYASVGAAIGTLAAEIVVWVVQFGALKQDIMPAYKKIQYPQMLLALVIGCVASVWVKMLGWNSFFVLLLSAILFLYLRSWRSITSSTRSMDTYISLLTCSERMIFPFTGMVTSIFCLSFSTLKVTMTFVSGVKYFSSLPSFSLTAAFNPSVTSIFFPLMVIFIMPNPFALKFYRFFTSPVSNSNYSNSCLYLQ